MTSTKQTVKQPTAGFDPRTFRFRNLDRYQQRRPHVVWRTRIHLFWRTRIHLFVCECVVCGCVSVWCWLCVCEVRAEFLLKIGGIISLLIPCRAFVVSFLNKLHESCLQKKKSVTGNFGYHSYEVIQWMST